MLAPDEAIYGLGQHQQSVMNHRGAEVLLLQKNREVAVPVLVSSRGYGVLWDNPAVTDVSVGAGDEQTIPAAQLYTEEGQPGGLTASYYCGQNFNTLVATQTDAQVHFNWSVTPPAGLPHDHNSVRWTGFIKAPAAGDYTLMASADDAMRVWIDANWTDFWTGKSYPGGQAVDAAAPIETMPLFVRAGSIIPYGPVVEQAMQKADPIELRVYRGGMEPSRSMKMKATITIMKKAVTRSSPFPGTNPNTSS